TNDPELRLVLRDGLLGDGRVDGLAVWDAGCHLRKVHGAVIGPGLPTAEAYDRDAPGLEVALGARTAHSVGVLDEGDDALALDEVSGDSFVPSRIAAVVGGDDLDVVRFG